MCVHVATSYKSTVHQLDRKQLIKPNVEVTLFKPKASNSFKYLLNHKQLIILIQTYTRKNNLQGAELNQDNQCGSAIGGIFTVRISPAEVASTWLPCFSGR